MVFKLPNFQMSSARVSQSQKTMRTARILGLSTIVYLYVQYVSHNLILRLHRLDGNRQRLIQRALHLGQRSNEKQQRSFALLCALIIEYSHLYIFWPANLTFHFQFGRTSVSQSRE